MTEQGLEESKLKDVIIMCICWSSQNFATHFQLKAELQLAVPQHLQNGSCDARLFRYSALREQKDHGNRNVSEIEAEVVVGLQILYLGHQSR